MKNKTTGRWGVSARGFLSIPPGRGDHRAATRMLLGLALPSLVLLALGHSELVIYAVFGGFTGMYGRSEPHQLRLFHQMAAAIFLIGCVLAGVLFAASPLDKWGFVAVETVLAGIGSLIAGRLRLRPIGPFFGLFAFGACAAIPTTEPLWLPPLVATLSAGSAITVGFVGWIHRRDWISGQRRTQAIGPAVPLHAELNTAALYVIAVGGAGAMATAWGWGHPYWAMAAAAVPLSAVGLAGGLLRGLHRVLGTYAGLVVAAVLLGAWRHPVFLVVLVIALQFPTEFYIGRHYALSLVFFTPLIMAMTYLVVPGDISTMVLDRAVETTIGAGIGMLALLLFNLRYRPSGRVATGVSRVQ